MGHHLTATDTSSQRIGQPASLRCIPPRLSGRTRGGATTFRLGLVHPHISVGQQAGNARHRVRYRNARACPNLYRAHAELIRRRQGRLNPFGEQRCRCPPRDTGGQHNELVAAHASHHIARTHRLSETHRDLHKQFIASLMAKQIVHRLEAIEVDEHHCNGPADCQVRIETRQHQRAIRQTSECIVSSHLLEVVTHALQFGHVVSRHHDARYNRVTQKICELESDRSQVVTIEPLHRQLDRRVAMIPTHRAQHIGQ